MHAGKPKGLFKGLRELASGQIAGLAEIKEAADRLSGEISHLARAVEGLATEQQAVCRRLARLERDAQQIKATIRLNESQRAKVETLDGRLDPARATAHIIDAIRAATLIDDPLPHIVVEDLLPRDVYALTLRAIPPESFFSDKDPIKQNMAVPMDFGPVLATRVWELVDRLAREAIRPAAMEKFHEPLQRHYDVVFGPGQRERAGALPQAVSGGRLMLRRAGYHLEPHRDPKRTLLTCLMYLAKEHDIEAYGTQIFRVTGDREASYTHTYYPGENGGRCELVKLVPFRPNTALIFLNSGGAHGADIPAGAPARLQRYAFQFYIGPDQDALDRLVADLPSDRQAMWRTTKR